MRQDTRERLELFVENAGILETSSFTKYIRENGINVEIKAHQGGSALIDLAAPDAEATRALTNTLRLFMNNNDPVSFGNVNKLTGDAGLSQEWIDQFIRIRSDLNNYLDSQQFTAISPEIIPWDGQAAIRVRDFQDVFVNGYYSHNTQYALYRRWKSEYWFDLFRHEFMLIMMNTLSIIFHLSSLTVLELNGQPLPTIRQDGVSD